MNRKIIAVILGTLLMLLGINCGGSGNGNGGDGTVTVLKITNTGTTSVVIGFVTAATGGACPDINNLLTAQELADAGWCTDYQAGVSGAGKCLVTIPAGSSVTVPNPGNKCLSGGFGIGGFASCETAEYPNGWTQGEFTLNPKATTQEAVDISAVNGVNYALSIELGSGWYYQSGSYVTTVGPNSTLNNNAGIPGVYPNGCTDCIQLVGDPVCPGLTTSPTCQTSRICNVYRDTTFGGTVEFKVGNLL